jgi:hypothetical protein
VNSRSGSPSSRNWLIALPTACLVLVAALWSGFWYYASGRAEQTVEAWRAREAGAGRIYDCGNASFGGYPFRIEYRCTEPTVDDRPASLAIRAHSIAAVAQVWDPTLVLGEIVGPLTLAPLGGVPAATIDWSLAQGSLRGMPGAPERLSIVLEQPHLAAPPANVADPLVKAEHAEFHARFAADSPPGHPVLDLALDVSQLTAPTLASTFGPPLGALASKTTDAAIVAVLRGANDLAPKPLAQRLREFQTADGRLEITNARFAQGDLVATAAGTLHLTARGALDGELHLTVINFAKLVPLLGIDRAVAQVMPQETLTRYAPSLDKLIPGLGSILRGGSGNAPGSGSNAPGNNPPPGNTSVNTSAAALGAAVLGGQPAELEGQSAVRLTLRFDDGAAFLGPFKIGQVPPLY